MSAMKTPINFERLADTGIALHVRLTTTPVTLEEAELLVSWLRAAFRTAQEELGQQATGIVPVIELQSGSLQAKVRLMFEKAGTFTAEVARDVAKRITEIMIFAALALPGATGSDQPRPDVVPPYDLTVIVRELDESGKPYVLELSDGEREMKIQGNQTEGQRRR